MIARILRCRTFFRNGFSYIIQRWKKLKKVTQVSGRFYIIKGLTETIDKYLIRTYPARLEIQLVTRDRDI